MKVTLSFTILELEDLSSYISLVLDLLDQGASWVNVLASPQVMIASRSDEEK